LFSAVRMTDCNVAVTGNDDGDVDGQHLRDVHQRPDERLQVDAQPVTGYAHVESCRSEHLGQSGRQEKEVVDDCQHLNNQQRDQLFS